MATPRKPAAVIIFVTLALTFTAIGLILRHPTGVLRTGVAVT